MPPLASGPRQAPSTNHKTQKPKKTKKVRGGRPLLSFAELEARKAARLAKRRRRASEEDPSKEGTHAERGGHGTQRPRRHGISLLERLPVELIEKVFLYALDTNLCRASPYLAAAVSSERIYRTLIRLAFWDDSSGEVNNNNDNNTLPLRNADAREWLQKALQPADYAMLRLNDAERMRLQSTIIRCKWFTRDRLEAQLPRLMQMTIQRHWYGAGITMSDAADQTALDRFLDRREDSKVYRGVLSRTFLDDNNNNDDDDDDDEDDSNNNTNDDTFYMSIIPFVSVSINCAEKNIRQVHRILRPRIFPNHLLRGNRTTGFSEETIDLLEIFRRAYGFNGTGRDVELSRDALQQGIRNALRSGNARALATLLKLDEFFVRRRLETEDSFDNDNHYYALPADHFVEAIKPRPVPSQSIELFKLLLRCNAESMPPDSPQITQWAMDLSHAKQGSEHVRFGRWLLDFVVELPRHIDGARRRAREEALFYYGAVNLQSAAGRRFVDEVCGGTAGEWQETWIQKVSYDVSQTWIAGEEISSS